MEGEQVNIEKSRGGARGEGECGETGVELFTRERRSLDILSVKEEAKLSASELVWRLNGIKKFESKRENFIFNTLRSFIFSQCNHYVVTIVTM